jgi:putative membrane protein insertion efficiency factor
MTEPWNAAEPPVPAPGIVAVGVLALVSAYKLLLSPLFAGSCRFQPSCSDYMAEAVRSHGAWSGVRLGLRRLARCHPFGSHGFDPVPRFDCAQARPFDAAQGRRTR